MRRTKPPVARPESRQSAARLWAPWRYAYLSATRTGTPACIFCVKRLAAAPRRKRLIVYANPLALVMLNRYPYTNGHLMVAARRHVPSPDQLTRTERAMIDELIVQSIAGLRDALRPAGFNLGANLGRAAGAGIADHLHWHVVPRWEGDSNFMPAIASVRMLSQHLEQSFDRLAPRFKAMDINLS